MVKMKLVVAILAILIVVGGAIAVVVIMNLPPAPSIPSDDIHIDRETCLDCHVTGENWHKDDVDSGKLSENVEDCMKCHDKAG
jgi:hypothetical protein